MHLHSVVRGSLLVLLTACGSDVRGPGTGGAGGSGGGATTSTSGGTGGSGGDDGAPCPDGGTFRSGVIIPTTDEERTCVETDGVSTMDLCVFVEEPGTGFRCFEGLVHGRRIWLPAPEVLPRDVDAWVECTEAHPDPPPPCFVTSACFNDPPAFAGTIVSTCSDPDTRSGFACGSDDSPYDAGCCPRTLCDAEGGCPAGLVCSTAGFSSYTACARSTDGTCGCFGTADAQEVDVCVAP